MCLSISPSIATQFLSSKPTSPLPAAVATASCNRAWRKTSTMLKNHLSRCYNTFRDLQLLQSRYSVAASLTLCCSCAKVSCHNRLQTRIAGASHHIDHNSGAAPNTSVFLKLSKLYMWNRALAKISCTFCRDHLPKLFRACWLSSIFEEQIELSLQSCALFVDNFSRSSPAPTETETLLRRPQETQP